MKRLAKWLAVLAVLGAVGWAASGPLRERWKEHNRVAFREAAVSRGRIVAVVNATGTVKPVRSVTVGSFVSGPILTLYVDFNDEIKKNDLLDAAYFVAKMIIASGIG